VTTVAGVGARVAEWATPAGIHCEQASDDGFLLTDVGLEVRWYLNRRKDSFEVSRAERAGQPQLEMRAFTLEDAERFLLSGYGPILRSAVMGGSPYLVVPWQRADLAPGFDLVENAEGPLWAGLYHHGRPRANFRSARNPDDAVMFSHIADASLDDIRNSFLDELGKPLFSVDPSRPTRH
jgi:hypothetical protein